LNECAQLDGHYPRGVASAGIDLQKKTMHAAEQDRPDVAEKRERWKRRAPHRDAERLIFIDEIAGRGDWGLK